MTGIPIDTTDMAVGVSPCGRVVLQLASGHKVALSPELAEWFARQLWVSAAHARGDKK